MLTPEDVAVITRGFEQLGSDRVRRAVAGRSTTCKSWAGCFLAQAYGDRGALDYDLNRVFEFSGPYMRVARLLGIGGPETAAISSAHTFAQDDLYSLAEEWLEDVEVVKNATPVPSHQ